MPKFELSYRVHHPDGTNAKLLLMEAGEPIEAKDGLAAINAMSSLMALADLAGVKGAFAMSECNNYKSAFGDFRLIVQQREFEIIRSQQAAIKGEPQPDELTPRQWRMIAGHLDSLARQHHKQLLLKTIDELTAGEIIFGTLKDHIEQES